MLEGFMPTISWPSNEIEPLLVLLMPEMAMKIELLPAPLAPSSTTSSPLPACRLTLSRARKLPYDSETPSSFSMFGSQVSVDHQRVAADLGRCALGDLLAVVQHDDLVGQAHDHVHLVLDQAHGLAVVHELADQIGQAHGFFGVHAAGGQIGRAHV